MGETPDQQVKRDAGSRQGKCVWAHLTLLHTEVASAIWLVNQSADSRSWLVGIHTWGNEAIHFFSFCYAARIPRLRVGTSVVSGYPFNQYEESPYRRRRMSYMKTPPLDVLLRYIPQVEYPPEDFANTEDSEVVVNQQSLYRILHLDHHNRFVSTPPTFPYFLSLSFPPPQLHCSAFLSLICSAPHIW